MHELQINYLSLCPCGDDLRVGIDNPMQGDAATYLSVNDVIAMRDFLISYCASHGETDDELARRVALARR